jgi:adenylate cyclase class IV
MLSELKIRLLHPEAAREKLIALDAVLVTEEQEVDTYFRQPDGKVLKLTETRSGTWAIELEKRGSGFAIVSRKAVDDVHAMRKKLEEMFGIDCTLRKKKESFRWNEWTFHILGIDNVGTFLIIEGESPLPASLVTENLGIQNPEFISVPFNELNDETKLTQ